MVPGFFAFNIIQDRASSTLLSYNCHFFSEVKNRVTYGQLSFKKCLG